MTERLQRGPLISAGTLLGIGLTHEVAWDVGFLILGALLVTGGWMSIHSGRSDTTPRGPPHVPGGTVHGHA